MSAKTLIRSSAGGEITPEAFGRLDLVKYQTGLELAENFIVLPHGPIVNRAGTEFVREVKASSKKAVGIPFIYNADQAYTLEFGDQYIRIHTDAATVLYGSPAAYNGATAYSVGEMVTSGGSKYYCIAATTGNAPPNATYWYLLPATGELEIPTPYLEADLYDLHFTQSADVLTITHPGYAPREFRRYSASRWVLATISFAPTIGTPGAPTVTASSAGSETNTYKVTAIASDGLEESYASAATSVTGVALATAGAYNTIDPTPGGATVSGAVRYNVYKLSSGLYGYIGQTDGSDFRDNNITADVTRTPPEAQNPFSGAGEYPGGVGYFQGRRWFCGSTNKPQNAWSTRSGTESNLSRSIPTRDDDAITLRLLSRQASTLRHLVPLSDLLLFTSEAEWSLTAQNSDVITPSTAAYKPQGYTGASNAQPVVTSASVVYASDRGGHVREMLYSWESQGYKSNDISIMAPHLVDGYTIKQFAYSRAPVPIVWAVRDDGVLLGVTYVPEHQVIGWHHHVTDGEIESACVIPENGQDMLYLFVKRTINGSTKRYVERMHTRVFAELADAFFVDCGATYSGAPATTISGLDHLGGETVVALADGAVVRDLVVTSGAVTLPVAASLVHVGLPITADAKTLPLAFEAQAAGQDKNKNVNKVHLRVNRSSGVWAGPDFDHLREYRQRTTEPYGSPPNLVTGRIEISLDPTWSADGQICIRQSDPLPLSVLSMVLEFSA